MAVGGKKSSAVKERSGARGPLTRVMASQKVRKQPQSSAIGSRKTTTKTRTPRRVGVADSVQSMRWEAGSGVMAV
jgi:hypothetical protein